MIKRRGKPNGGKPDGRPWGGTLKSGVEGGIGRQSVGAMFAFGKGGGNMGAKGDGVAA